MLKEKKIKISKASIGEINKKDLVDTESQKDELNKVIIGFNVKNADIKEVKVITSDIIYRIIEDLEKFREEKAKEIELRQLGDITRPCKLVFLRNYIFRQNNPAVIGVEVFNGKLKVGMKFIKKDGSSIGEVKSIQSDGKGIGEIDKGKQVAISLPSVTVGKQIIEGDVFYSNLTENNFKKVYPSYTEASEGKDSGKFEVFDPTSPKASRGENSYAVFVMLYHCDEKPNILI